MLLDPKAQGLVTQIESLVTPEPLFRQGVERTRALLRALPPAELPPMHTVEDRIVPGPDTGVLVRIFRPCAREDLPVFVWFHGAAWVLGDANSGVVPLLQIARDIECVVVSVGYRLAPEHKFPAAFDDCCAALRWVAERGGTIGVDSSRLAFGGESSGASLAASVALHARDTDALDPDLLVLIVPGTEYPTGDLRPSFAAGLRGTPTLWSQDITWSQDQYHRDERDRQDPRAVPSAAKTLTGLPPTFVVTAGVDPLRDDGIAFAERLASEGVPTEHHHFEDMFHGFFSSGDGLAQNSQAREHLAAALRRSFERVKS